MRFTQNDYQMLAPEKQALIEPFLDMFATRWDHIDYLEYEPKTIMSEGKEVSYNTKVVFKGKKAAPGRFYYDKFPWDSLR